MSGLPRRKQIEEKTHRGSEYPCIDFLLHHNEGQFRIVGVKMCEDCGQLWDLMFLHNLQLPITHTITVNHDGTWQGMMELTVSREKQKMSLRIIISMSIFSL